jgi:hypothetical protein
MGCQRAGWTVTKVIAFALGALLMYWVGKTFFHADVTFDELVRTLGLAYVWNVVSFLGLIALGAPGLTCITGPVTFLAAIAGLVSWFFAAKEALDLDWPQVIGVVIIGWVVMVVMAALIASLILGLLGLAGAGVMSLFHTVGNSIYY